MHPQFIQLFPYVLAGIILGTFIPFGNNSPPTRGIPPSFSPNAGDEANASPPPGVAPDNHSGLHGLLIRCLASLWDAFGNILALSTTSHGGDSCFPPASVDSADARARISAAARAHGWVGLVGALNDGLTMLGTLRGPNNLVTQDEMSYVRCCITYPVLDVLSRHDEAALSPGVLFNVTRRFVRTGQIPPIPSITGPLHLDADDIDFIIRSIMAIATLVTAIIFRVEDEPVVGAAFSQFAEDPTSWARFTHSADPVIPSVEQIVRLTHRPHFHAGSSRILTVGPSLFGSHSEGKAPSTSSGLVLTGCNNRTRAFSYGAAPHSDVGVGAENVTLRDEELEYLAALFVAALMGFHARGTTASKRAN